MPSCSNMTEARVKLMALPASSIGLTLEEVLRYQQWAVDIVCKNLNQRRPTREQVYYESETENLYLVVYDEKNTSMARYEFKKGSYTLNLGALH